ncbi:TmcC family electron transfer complex membrane anchor subunit [Desulfovibrio oxyclinae]|jgi:nitrate reductase gamma subunit|uniref:TmcC family electron transfer complex membrane anchor subunit n=1 Tax=Desulfovibrio oxyclinae TaxID=63560 RepID=UPI00036EC92C|nr:hypothetical protein [Desulfovibrio oxyclinae]
MFNEIYEFVTGPLAWFGWGVFILGSIWKLTSLWSLARKKDQTSIHYVKPKFALRSIAHWLTPFGTLGWRENPAVTVVTFIFHICLVLVPIFLSAHVILWEEWFGVSIPALPNTVADIMTVLVILCGAFYAWRRLSVPEVAFVTEAKDWWVLGVVVAPFVTGFLAYHQIFNYEVMIVLHVVTGIAWLALIPFSRLSHMLVSWYSRAYIGSEFQGVRHCKDW